jgi:hypothetical protein
MKNLKSLLFGLAAFGLATSSSQAAVRTIVSSPATLPAVILTNAADVYAITLIPVSSNGLYSTWTFYDHNAPSNVVFNPGHTNVYRTNGLLIYTNLNIFGVGQTNYITNFQGWATNAFAASNYAPNVVWIAYLSNAPTTIVFPSPVTVGRGLYVTNSVYTNAQYVIQYAPFSP